MTPPTKGVQVPEEDNAASSKPNSVLDVPISRDSRLLRGPRIYVALEAKVRSDISTEMVIIKEGTN